MKPSAASTIDACQIRLHGAGWSIGDAAIQSTEGFTWMVFAHRGEERVVAKGRRQAAAWREAVRLAVGTNGARNGKVP